ncbi:MAG: hypothetical protein U0132_17265 [Gemmatimonadaceae bacterium]
MNRRTYLLSLAATVATAVYFGTALSHLSSAAPTERTFSDWLDVLLPLLMLAAFLIPLWEAARYVQHNSVTESATDSKN